MYNKASEIVYIINLLLQNDKKPPIVEKDFFTGTKGEFIQSKRAEFEQIVKGYISYVRGNNPATFPKQLFPNSKEMVTLYKPATIDEKFKSYKFVECKLSEAQQTVHDSILEDEKGETKNAFNVPGLMACFMVYPKKEKKTISYVASSNAAFDDYFEIQGNKYTIKNKKTEPFFDTQPNLELHSPKIASLMKSIKESEGIVFVWCHYKKGMAIPLALILSYYGLQPYEKAGSLMPSMAWNGTHQDFVKKDEDGKKRHKYVFLGTETNKENQMEKLLEVCNSDANKNGDIIKVIIATSVAEEGVDFKNIRQIHVLHPWYNMSRIDQIIGRGIRTCSHKLLDQKTQNDVTVFLYCSSGDKEKETTDEINYKNSLEKDLYIKQVELSLKKAAVDCHSNIATNQDKSYGDKKGDRECAYGECDAYKCIGIGSAAAAAAADTINTTTYNPEMHSKALINDYKYLIKKMFSKGGVVFSLMIIEDFMKIYIQTRHESALLYIALSVMISNKELLYDKYGRLGTLVYEDGYYYFHPNDLNKSMPNIPEYYRKTPLTVKSLFSKLPKISVDFMAKVQSCVNIFKAIVEKVAMAPPQSFEPQSFEPQSFEPQSFDEYDNYDVYEDKKKKTQTKGTYGKYLLQHKEKQTYTRALITYYMDRLDTSVLDFILSKSVFSETSFDFMVTNTDTDTDTDTNTEKRLYEIVRQVFRSYFYKKTETQTQTSKDGKMFCQWSSILQFNLHMNTREIVDIAQNFLHEEETPQPSLPYFCGTLTEDSSKSKDGFIGLGLKIFIIETDNSTSHKACVTTDFNKYAYASADALTNKLKDESLKKYYENIKTKPPANQLNSCIDLELLMRQVDLIKAVPTKPTKTKAKAKAKAK